MKRIGPVTRIGAGTIIVRSPGATFPDVGAEVITEMLETIGRVVDVIGPVERPYVVISSKTDVHGPSLLNEPVYAR